MTVVGAKDLNDPESLAEFFKADMDWQIDIANRAGFETPYADRIKMPAYQAMKNNRTEVDHGVSKSISSCLMTDSFWWTSYVSWYPPSIRRSLTPMVKLFERNVRSTAKQYATDIGIWERKDFTSRDNILFTDIVKPGVVNRRKANILAGQSVAMTEWFQSAAEILDMDIPDNFYKTNYRDVPKYFAGHDINLPKRVRDFQYALFDVSVEWTEVVADKYDFSGPLVERPIRYTDIDMVKELKT
jgi:hypothetical protein